MYEDNNTSSRLRGLVLVNGRIQDAVPWGDWKECMISLARGIANGESILTIRDYVPPDVTRISETQIETMKRLRSKITRNYANEQLPRSDFNKLIAQCDQFDMSLKRFQNFMLAKANICNLITTHIDLKGQAFQTVREWRSDPSINGEPAELWATLCGRFETLKRNADQAAMRKAWHVLAIEDGEDIRDFITRFQRIITELKLAGLPRNEADVIEKFISCIEMANPTEYNPMVTHLSLMQNEKKSFDEIALMAEVLICSMKTRSERVTEANLAKKALSEVNKFTKNYHNKFNGKANHFNKRHQGSFKGKVKKSANHPNATSHWTSECRNNKQSRKDDKQDKRRFNQVANGKQQRQKKFDITDM